MARNFKRSKSNPKLGKSNYQDKFADAERRKGYDQAEAKFMRCPRISREAENDPWWYYKDSAVLSDVASFSFSAPLGSKLHTDKFLPDAAGFQVSQVFNAVPGLLTIGIAPTVGVAETAQDPINLAATNVYSYVRYKNSGSANYDSPDLMLYLVAMDSIYSCWNWLKRLYGVASTYSQQNWYEPRSYFTAENVDFDDVISNLADFRAWLNVKTSEIAAFCVPATMSLNIRHSWLYANVFTDANTRKAQQYMYIPAYFYQYDESSSPNGGILKPVPIPNGTIQTRSTTPMKLSDLKQILNGMLEAVNYSEDIGIMSGDILKAYGEGNLFTISHIDPDYKVTASYSQEVLTQFENAIITSFNPSDLQSFQISQEPNTNFIQCKPVTTSAANITFGNRFVNFHHDSPKPEEVMVATRLNAVLGANTGTGGSFSRAVLSCGSEIAVGAFIVYNAQSAQKFDPLDPTAPLSPQIEPVTYRSAFAANPESVGIAMLRVALLSAFDWHPIFPIGVNTSETNAKTSFLGALWDWDVYTSISAQNLESMNLLALLSELNVPN